jgi:hypothetical protein
MALLLLLPIALPRPLDLAVQRLQSANDFVRGRHQAAHSTVEADRTSTFDRQADVFDHLAG